MSQEPGAPLENVPVTKLKKRKMKGSHAPPSDSNESTNNANLNPQNTAQSQQSTQFNKDQNTNNSTIQQEHVPPAQAITDVSSLGPMKKRKAPSRQSSTESEPLQTTANASQPNNISSEPQQTDQQDQGPSSEPTTDISSLGPLKKRKAPKITFSDSPLQSASNSTEIAKSPSLTPIETNEIPNIDIMSDSSNENLHATSSGSRLGLDIEQDNTLSGRYMNPNFDLSKIGKNESKQLLNKSISKEYAERFTRDMAAREEQFRKEYIKPKEKVDEQLVNSAFLESELKSMIETISKNVQANTAKFDLSKCNFNDIPVTSNNSFEPNLSGIAKSYTMNSQEALNSLSGKRELPSINELKTELEANFLKAPENPNENDEDFINQVKILFDQSNKQISPTEFLIDLSMNESVNLICKIALFFAAGLKCHPSVLFDRLYGQMNEDSRGRANIVSLQSALLQAKSSITDITGNYRYTVFYVLHLIRLAQCSSLLRYMSELLTFKKKNYYGDALILDSELCNSLSDEIEKIECVQIQGGLIRINIPDTVPAVSGERFALRVEGIVDSYLRKTRNWLLQGVEINSEHILPLADVLKIFVKCFLIQKNGNCLSLDALYDIFEGIANLSNLNNNNNNNQNSNTQNNEQQITLDPCCDHPAYKRFVEIFRGKDVTKYWDTRTKIWVTIITALNEKILPYIILFGVKIPQTKTTMNPAYFRDPVSCLRIAHALLPIKYPSFNVRYESIKHAVSTLD